MPRMSRTLAFAAAAALPLVACHPAPEGPNATMRDEPGAAFSAIGPDETVRFTGTEPFWGGEVHGGTLTYSTPENADGVAIAVERFAGNGGLGYSGQLDGRRFDMAITPGDCSDGMSDRTYPFTVTLEIGDEHRSGCGWTETTPFTGPEHP